MSWNRRFTDEEYHHAYVAAGNNASEAGRNLGASEKAVREGNKRYLQKKPLSDAGYELAKPEETPEEAWRSHTATFERTLTERTKNHWAVITRPRGAFVVYHSTDQHIDDNATPLNVLEADIEASHGLDAVMCHGGDLLNNWPLAGKLAAQWADQDCTKPRALLRAQHYIEIMKPDAWVDGNHEEMNPYLTDLLKQWLPKKTIQDKWTVRFVVKPKGGREFRIAMSHKFQKGSSWFHTSHGALREGMEGEEADCYLEGHLHVNGIMYRTLPERGFSFCAVSSAGYKILDKYASRISRGGVIPKVKGRAHWLVCDDQAEGPEMPVVAFEEPWQAEAYLNGLQNLRAA